MSATCPSRIRRASIRRFRGIACWQREGGWRDETTPPLLLHHRGLTLCLSDVAAHKGVHEDGAAERDDLPADHEEPEAGQEGEGRRGGLAADQGQPVGREDACCART